MIKYLTIIIFIINRTVDCSEAPRNPYSLKTLCISKLNGFSQDIYQKKVIHSIKQDKVPTDVVAALLKIAFEQHIDGCEDRIKFFKDMYKKGAEEAKAAREAKKVKDTEDTKDKIVFDSVACSIKSKLVWQNRISVIKKLIEDKREAISEEEKQIGNSTMYAVEQCGGECAIAGTTKIYVLDKDYTIVDGTSLSDEVSVVEKVISIALYTDYAKSENEDYKRTMIFAIGTTLWLQSTDYEELLRAPVNVITHKIIYDIDSDNQINKIGLLATENENSKMEAYITGTNDHPPSEGTWFRGSSLWKIPVEQVKDIAFKNNALVVYTPTSWSAWAIKYNQENDSYFVGQIPYCIEEEVHW